MNQDLEADGVYDDDVFYKCDEEWDEVLKDGALLGVGGIVVAARVNNVVYYHTNIYIRRNSLARPGLPQRRPGDQFERGVRAGQAQGSRVGHRE